MSIKDFASVRGLTQKELASVLGISKASMSRRVAVKTELKLRDLQRIWEVYGPLSKDEIRLLLH